MKKIAGEHIGFGYDVVKSLLISVFISISWGSISYFNDSFCFVEDRYVVIIGSIVAISGLLFRQYMVKEVVEYLNNFNKIVFCISSIIEYAEANKFKSDLMEKIYKMQIDVLEYVAYMKKELKIVPVVPIMLIFLYGCSVLSEGVLRYATLYLMVLCVSYLCVVSISSASIATNIVEINGFVDEYQSLVKEISKSSD